MERHIIGGYAFSDSRMLYRDRNSRVFRPEWHMRIPKEILESVFFIGRYNGEHPSKDDFRFVGTGFIVSWQLKGCRKEYYFITAKHVVAKCKSIKLAIRYCDSNGNLVYWPLGADATWKYHPTEAKSVDCAIIAVDPQDMSAKSLPVGTFLRKEISDKQIGLGDEVFTVGLFRFLTGLEKNIPLVRTGNVAMLPDEPCPDVRIMDYIGPSDMYLIESRSLGGLSGSPCFAFESISTQISVPRQYKNNIEHMAGYGQIRFIGLMHGHWTIDPKDQNDSELHASCEPDAVSVGISLVVPAYKILEILEQPYFADERKRLDDEWVKSKATTPT